jgi:NADH dehydrogenase FAD-containing subunit
MEAGIKEQKGVFTMRRPLVRSPIGLELQEQFSLFAANFVRWAAQWAREQAVRQATCGLQEAWGETKPLVRVVGQTRARLVQTPEGRAVGFAGDGPFAGSVLVFVGHVAYQEVLPLFRSQAYMPCEVT